MRQFLSFLVAVVIFSSCETSKKPEANQQSNVHKVTVEEVLQVRGYTYLRVLEDGNEKWLAGPTSTVEIGETYYYENPMVMKNFESKELKRSFETIYFIAAISNNPEGTNPQKAEALQGQSTPQLVQTSKKPVIEKKEVSVDTISDGITIAELFENKEKYKNTVVKLKGKVVKYNPAIMNVNWFHIQDGSDFNGEFDLTVTSTEEVKIGDIVTLQGKVILNKDFGAGYFYNIIVENATLIK